MSITLGSNFTLNTTLPLDDRAVVADTTARDAIPLGRRYEGMSVYCIADGKNYQLVGGTADINWKEYAGAGGSFVVSSQLGLTGALAISNAGDKRRIVQVSSSGGEVDLSPLVTQLTIGSSGDEVILIGTDSANYIVLKNTLTNLNINGDWYGYANSVLHLVQVGIVWFEVQRR